MKRLLIIILVFSVAAAVFAQQASEIGSPNPESLLGLDAAQQYLKEVSVEKFEREGFWRSAMSPDDGYTTSRLFNGAPAGKVTIPDEGGLNIQDKFVFGTRV